MAAAVATSIGYLRLAPNRNTAERASGTIMTRKVHRSPLVVPPNTYWDTAPNSSGASAWAPVRMRLRMPSARPHRNDGMMSSRAASIGGFWADRQAAASTMYGSAVSELLVSSAGMNNSTVIVAATAATITRPFRP